MNSYDIQINNYNIWLNLDLDELKYNGIVKINLGLKNKIGQIKILNYLGKISYGLYIYHMTAIYLVIFLFKKDESTIWLQMFVALFLTISISAFSFKYIEKYFQEIKKKFI